MATEEQGPLPQRSLQSASEAEQWQQDVDRRRHDFAPTTERMLEAAGLQPGDHVLDIAAGTGDQSFLAARLVGPGGSILATDISADMLSIAARLAELEGLTNITTHVMDLEQLELEDDTSAAVIEAEHQKQTGKMTERLNDDELEQLNSLLRKLIVTVE